MKIKNLKFKICLLVFTICFLIFNIDKTTAAGLSLSINPPVIQIQISPPAIVNRPITIENHGEEAVTLKILYKPFVADKGESGEVVYESDNNTLIFEKIKVRDDNEAIEKVVIAPKQNKTLNLYVDIPKSETLSDYYFSIIFISEDTSGDTLNQSGISGGIATNVLLSIKNEETSIGSIVEFSSPRFLEKGPVPFKIRLKNESKHFITPDGEILIRNIFGKTIGQVKLDPVNILADTTRKEELLWKNGFMFGLYTATLSINILDNDPALVKTIRFLVIPIQNIIILTAIPFLILLIKRRLRARHG